MITSTRLISVPAGGIGRLVTLKSSPGMSCSLPVTSQKKWWWSEVLVSKYDRPGSTTTSCNSPEFGELMKRVVDGRERHPDARRQRLAVQLLGRDVALTAFEQEPCQSDTLACGPQICRTQAPQGK